MSSGAHPEDFLGLKRTQLKRGADQGVSDRQAMEALHFDRSRMLVQVQGVDKHGDGSRWAGGWVEAGWKSTARAGWEEGGGRALPSRPPASTALHEGCWLHHTCCLHPRPLPDCRWVLRVVMQPVQPAAAGRLSLVQALDAFGKTAAGAAASEHSSRSTSPEPADFQ